MKILITGTHFTPAVAVIEELKKMGTVSMVYVGRRTTMEGDNTRSIESKVLPTLAVKFIPMIAGRLQRAFTPYTILSLLKIPVGFIQALYIILSEKPDVILSFGGYVAVPIVFWGWLWSVPIIIHEQTLVSGLANKISAIFADKIAISFDNSEFKGEKIILTGNPIRREILKISAGMKKTYFKNRLPVVLIMGGNQGSHVINLAVEGCLDKLLKIARVYHQTGDSKYHDFERLENLGGLGERYKVRKWIGAEYPEILYEADLVICRAGINTLTELAYLDKPALVIPIPYLYKDEQNKNAGYFQRLGLVKILPQHKLSSENLVLEVTKMLKSLPVLTEAAKNAKSNLSSIAAKRIALETMLLVKYV